jgi:hypothetical protein
MANHESSKHRIRGRLPPIVGKVGAWLSAGYRLSLLCLLLLSPLSVGQSVRVAGVKRYPVRPDLLTLVLTVSATPALVSFPLVSGGVASGSSAIAITTGCVLSVGLPTQFTLYGYFASSAAALSGGSPVSNIPSSDVLGEVPTGSPTTFTAFTQSGPLGAAGSSLLLWTTTTDLCLFSNRIDNLSLEINLASLPQLPAATYTGTLFLEAQAM